MSQTEDLLSPARQDALKEIFNIGSGNAATTLSEAVRLKVLVSVPQIKVSTPEEALSALVKPDLPVVCMINAFFGDIAGCTLWMMPGDSAKEFAEECWHKMPGSRSREDFHFGNIHREISSVLTEAYLNALGDMLELSAIPSPPEMASGPMKVVLGRVLNSHGREGCPLAYVQNRFRFLGGAKTFSGYFMMLPDQPSLESILGKLGV